MKDGLSAGCCYLMARGACLCVDTVGRLEALLRVKAKAVGEAGFPCGAESSLEFVDLEATVRAAGAVLERRGGDAFIRWPKGAGPASAQRAEMANEGYTLNGGVVVTVQEGQRAQCNS